MKYATFNPDGSIAQACNDDTVAELPGGALSMTGEQFANWPAYRRSEDGLSLVLADPVPPVPPTIPEEIAAMLAAKGVTRQDVWNCILASNAYCQAQATATGQPLAAVTAYNRSKNKFFRECEALEAAIRVREVLL